MPVPPFLNKLLTFKLKLISSRLAVDLMSLLGLSVFREGNVIDLGVTQLQVVDACSGLGFVYPLILMGLIIGYLFHKRWWERIVLVTITIPISVGSNALRIAITGFLTEKVSPELAEGFFHGFSGWLVFMVSLGILLIVGRIMKGLGRNSGSSRELKAQASSLSAISYQLSAGTLCSASAILLAFGLVQYGVASSMIKPARTSLADFPYQISEWQGERTFLTQDIMESLWADDYVQIHFANR
ncbi:MAG: exosortase, partial [Candidatus Subteraquimicrobiales bacterium]|nr:exosortase [Candidatus Subteraquimicrobiales bacterium]